MGVFHLIKTGNDNRDMKKKKTRDSLVCIYCQTLIRGGVGPNSTRKLIVPPMRDRERV